MKQELETVSADRDQLKTAQRQLERELRNKTQLLGRHEEVHTYCTRVYMYVHKIMIYIHVHVQLERYWYVTYRYGKKMADQLQIRMIIILTSHFSVFHTDHCQAEFHAAVPED